jgi:hypothetical protein
VDGPGPPGPARATPCTVTGTVTVTRTVTITVTRKSTGNFEGRYTVRLGVRVTGCHGDLDPAALTAAAVPVAARLT